MKLLSSAIQLPQRLVLSTELDQQHGLEPGHTAKHFLIDQRYYASGDETADKLGATALTKALGIADLRIEDLDCVIAACATSAQAIPYNAASIYRHMGSNRPIHTFDVGMTCLSFLQALDVANLYLSSGRYKRLAIVSTEVASVGLNHQHMESASIFGDGAVAYVFERELWSLAQGSGGSTALSFGVKNVCFETVHEAYDFCEIRAGGSTRHISKATMPEQLDQYRLDATFRMDGKRLYKHVLKEFRPFVDACLDRAGMEMEDIDLVIPHQASGHGLKHVQRLLGVGDERFFNVFSQYGNQVAASIPLALNKAIEQGRVKRGNRVLLLGTSAGMSYGSVIVEIR